MRMAIEMLGKLNAPSPFTDLARRHQLILCFKGKLTNIKWECSNLPECYLFISFQSMLRHHCRCMSAQAQCDGVGDKCSRDNAKSLHVLP